MGGKALQCTEARHRVSVALKNLAQIGEDSVPNYSPSESLSILFEIHVENPGNEISSVPRLGE
jgi:hypothetical protein